MNLHKIKPFELPDAPEFSDAEIDSCRENSNFLPIFFKIQKKTVELTITCAQLRPESLGIRDLPRNHFAILVGLLNRCCRLSLAVNNLGHAGLFGETTRLLMRCIIEASVKVRWLIHKDSNESFIRFICDGLKAELKLKKEIQKNISMRSGVVLPIEKRLEAFSQRFFDIASVSDDEVVQSRKLPDLASMCRELSLRDLFYLTVYQVGSHSIHGSWPDLCTYYLKFNENGPFHVQDHNAHISENEVLYTCLFVLKAVSDFVEYIIVEESEREKALQALEPHISNISKFHKVLCERDQ